MKSELPFGVSGYTTWPLTFEQDLALLKKEKIGFIELCEAKLNPLRPDEQLRRLLDSGLAVSSIQPRLHSLFPDAPRPEPRAPAARMAALRKTIRLMGRYFPGATLVTISGAAPGGDFAAAYRTAVREYKQIAKAASDHGVRVALEPLNPILMNADTFVCSFQEAGRIVEEIDHPAFGLFFDVWHVWQDSGIEALIRKYRRKIFGVHINDWKTPRAFGDRFLPGEGEIPLERLLAALRLNGYRGAYTLEIFSELHLTNSLWKNPGETVRRGRKAFEHLWKKVCGLKTR